MCTGTGSFEVAPACVTQSGCRDPIDPDESFTITILDGETNAPLTGPIYSVDAVTTLECASGLSGIKSYPDLIQLRCVKDAVDNYDWQVVAPNTLITNVSFACEATDCPSIMLGETGTVAYDELGKFDTGVATITCNAAYSGIETEHECTVETHAWDPTYECVRTYCEPITFESLVCSYATTASQGLYAPATLATCACNAANEWWPITNDQTFTTTCESENNSVGQWQEFNADAFCQPTMSCEQFSENVIDVVYTYNGTVYNPVEGAVLPVGTVVTRRCDSYPFQPANASVPSRTTTCEKYGWKDTEFDVENFCVYRGECTLPSLDGIGDYVPSQVWYGGSVDIFCPIGYEQTNAIRTANCDSKGLDVTLSCVTQTHCYALDTSATVTYSSNSTTFLHPVGTTMSVVCPTGTSSSSVLLPDHFTATCSSNFLWVSPDQRITDPTSFNCVASKCPGYEQDYAIVDGYSAPFKEVTSTVLLSCIDTYNLSSDEQPTCQEDGTWYPIVTCNAQSAHCLPFTGAYDDVYTYQGISVSVDSAGGYPSGTALTRKCKFPQEPINSAITTQTATCSANDWSELLPSNIQLCKDVPSCSVPAVTNGVTSTSLAYRDETVTLTCASQYQPTAGVATATCLETGLLSQTLSCEPQTACIPRTVPTDDNYGYVYTDASGVTLSPVSVLLPAGTISTTACNAGLSPSGNAPNSLSFTCVQQSTNVFTWVASSTYNISSFKCVSTLCGSLVVAHGTSAYTSGRALGSNATVTCDTSYLPVNSISTSTCAANGLWSTVTCGEARCLPKSEESLSCSYLGTNGQPVAANTTRYDPGYRAVCTCSPTYYGAADSSPLQYICSDLGELPYSWAAASQSQAANDCALRVPCLDFEVYSESGEFNQTLSYTASASPGTGAYPVGTTAMVGCAYPTEPINSNVRTANFECQNWGWDPAGPFNIDSHCQLMPTCDLPDIAYGTTASTAGLEIIYTGDTIRVTCAEYYKPSASTDTSVCTVKGFEPPVECVEKSCDLIEVAGFQCTYRLDDAVISMPTYESTAECTCADGYAGSAETTFVYFNCMRGEEGTMIWRLNEDGDSHLDVKGNLYPNAVALEMKSGIDGGDAMNVFTVLDTSTGDLDVLDSTLCRAVTPCNPLQPDVSDSVGYSYNQQAASLNANGTYSRNTTAMYYCEYPYVAKIESQQTYDLTCTDNGWIASTNVTLPLCAMLPTCTLPTIANGRAIREGSGPTETTVYKGSSIYVECDDQYVANEDASWAECIDTETFSNTLVCRSTRCDNPQWVSYSCSHKYGDTPLTATDETFIQESTMTCRCAQGFDPLPAYPGDPSQTNPIQFYCGTDEKSAIWLPVDEERTATSRPCVSSYDCGVPPNITNGVVTYSNTIAGSYARVQCNQHFYIQNTKLTYAQFGCSATGWQARPVCTVCTDPAICEPPFPQITVARFSNSMASVQIIFNKDTNQPAATGGTGACSYFFPTSTVNRFGQSPTCSWRNARTLRVKLGRDFSLGVNTTITVRGARIRTLGEADRAEMYNQEETPVVAMSTAPAAIVPLLDTPSVVGLDAAFLVSSLRSTGGGGRAFNYTWAIASSTLPTLNLTTLRNSFNTLVTAQTVVSASYGATSSPSYMPVLNVPASFFPAGYNYTLRLTVKPWYNDTTVSVSTTVVMLEMPMPTISVPGGPTFYVSSSLQTRIPVLLQYATARTNSSAAAKNVVTPLFVSWALLDTSPDASFTVDNNALTISAYALKPGYTYQFRVTVEQQSIAILADVDITVVCEVGPLLPRILALSGTHPLTTTLSLSGVQSLDRDHNPDEGDDLELMYSWTCAVVNSPSELCWPAWIMPVDVTAEIEASDLLPAADSDIDITLTITKNMRSASTTTRITLVNITHDYTVLIQGQASDKLPAGTITRMRAVVTKNDDSLPDPVVYWTCDTRNVDMTDLSIRHTATLLDNALAFAANGLTAGVTYTFRASLYPTAASVPTTLSLESYPVGPLPDELASSTITLTINEPPSGGACSAESTSTTSHVLRAGVPFALYCQQWSDEDGDQPLRYLFMFDTTFGTGLDAVTLQAEIAPISFSPRLVVSLDFPATVTFTALIYDKYNAVTSVAVTVTLAARDSTSETLLPVSMYLNSGLVDASYRVSIDSFTVVVANILIRLTATAADVQGNAAVRLQLLEQIQDPAVQTLLGTSQTMRKVALSALRQELEDTSLISTPVLPQFPNVPTWEGSTTQSEMTLQLVAGVCARPLELTADVRSYALKMQMRQAAGLTMVSGTPTLRAPSANAMLMTLKNIMRSFDSEAALINRNTTAGRASSTLTTSTGAGPSAGTGVLHSVANAVGKTIMTVLGVPLPVADPGEAAEVAAARANGFRDDPRLLPLDPYAAIGAGPEDVNEDGVLIGKKRAALMNRIRARKGDKIAAAAVAQDEAEAAAAAAAAQGSASSSFLTLSSRTHSGVVTKDVSSNPESADNQALIAAMRAEAAALINLIPAQLAVLAFNTMGPSVSGEAADSLSQGGIQLVTQHIATNAGAAPSIVTAPSGGARVTLPNNIAGSMTTANTGSVNMVLSVIESTDLMALASVPDGEYLNGTSSSSFVSLSMQARSGSTPLLVTVGDSLTVPIPQTQKFDTTQTNSAFIITIPNPSAIDGSFSPVCEYWSPRATGTGGAWSTDGCKRVSFNTTFTVCSCTHLTMFRSKIQMTDFLPSFNTISARDFLNLTPENVRKHPVPLIAICVWFVICAIFFVVAVRIDRIKDKEAMRKLHRQWIVSAERTDATENPEIEVEMTAFQKLKTKAIYSLRHDHLWVSIFLREDAHSYSSAGRALTACVLFLSGYFVNAMFYGNDQAQLAFISISVISAAIMLPIGFILSLVFALTQKARVKTMLYTYAEHLCFLRYTGEGNTDTYVGKPEHQLKWFSKCTPAVERIQLNEIARLAAWRYNHYGQKTSGRMDPRNEQKLKLRLRTQVDVSFEHLMKWYETRPLFERFPRGLRLVGFIFLTMWVFFCIMMILVYGMQFDLFRANATVEWIESSALSNALDIFLLRMVSILAKTAIAIFLLSAIFKSDAAEALKADSELSTLRKLEDDILQAELDAEEAEAKRNGGEGLTPDELDALRRKRQAEMKSEQKRLAYARARDLGLDNATEADDYGAEAERERRDADRQKRAAELRAQRGGDLEMSQLDFTTGAERRRARKNGTAKAKRASAVLGLGNSPSRNAHNNYGADENGEYVENGEDEVYRPRLSVMLRAGGGAGAGPPSPSVNGSDAGRDLMDAINAERAAAEERQRQQDAAAREAAAASTRAELAAARAAAIASKQNGAPPSLGMVPAYQRMSFSAGATSRAMPRPMLQVRPTDATSSGGVEGVPSSSSSNLAAAAKAAPTQSVPATPAFIATPAPGRAPAAAAGPAPASSAAIRQQQQVLMHGATSGGFVTRPLMPAQAQHRSVVTSTSALEGHLRQMQADHDVVAAAAYAEQQMLAEAQARHDAAQRQQYNNGYEQEEDEYEDEETEAPAVAAAPVAAAPAAAAVPVRFHSAVNGNNSGYNDEPSALKPRALAFTGASAGNDNSDEGTPFQTIPVVEHAATTAGTVATKPGYPGGSPDYGYTTSFASDGGDSLASTDSGLVPAPTFAASTVVGSSDTFAMDRDATAMGVSMSVIGTDAPRSGHSPDGEKKSQTSDGSGDAAAAAGARRTGRAKVKRSAKRQ